MSDRDLAADESLAGQRLHLASLETCEDRIRILREQECDLEVEHIAAQAALNSATTRLQPKMDAALASRIGRSLERRRELEERRRDADAGDAVRPIASTRKTDQLRAGRAALLVWLDASRPQEPGAVARAAKYTLLIATIASVWAAIAIHPAFLLLLVVVVGPVSFAMGRGKDAQWRRVGAQRRFAGSGLADIVTWNDETVQARVAELDALLAATHRHTSVKDAELPPEDSSDPQTLARQKAEEDKEMASALSAAGLAVDDIQGEIGDWLRLVARADRSRESLERVKDERKRLRAEAAVLRDRLLRYLQSQGISATKQQDTVSALAERLDRLPDSG